MERYETCDLSEAAYLYVEAKLTKTTREETGKVYFSFESPELSRLRVAWNDGTGEVIAIKYAAALRHLKRLTPVQRRR